MGREDRDRRWHAWSLYRSALVTPGTICVDCVVRAMVDWDAQRKGRADYFESIGEMNEYELGRFIVIHEDPMGLMNEFSHAIPVGDSCFMLGVPEDTMEDYLNTSLILHMPTAVLECLFGVVISAEE